MVEVHVPESYTGNSVFGSTKIKKVHFGKCSENDCILTFDRSKSVLYFFGDGSITSVDSLTNQEKKGIKKIFISEYLSFLSNGIFDEFVKLEYEKFRPVQDKLFKSDYNKFDEETKKFLV